MPPIDLGNFAQDSNNPMKPMEMASAFSPMTALFNISGQPAASVPIHWNENNLPIGLQLITNSFEEQKLLNVARNIEETINYSESPEKWWLK